MLNIGDRIELCTQVNIYRGVIIDFLQADVTPPAEKINLYYGENAPKRAFEPSSMYRIIIKKDKGSFLVMNMNHFLMNKERFRVIK